MIKYTPMMEQYLKIKEEYKTCLVFFRLGDFYELFFDDALVASEVLDIALTGRDCGQDEKAPMCGVPYHAADTYISRLTDKGFKVAICEQTEDPKATKTIVKREVVRIITPGTVIDQNVLDSTKNNYIMSVYMGKDEIGLAFADVTTGEFVATGFHNLNAMRIVDEVARFAPAEIICNKDFDEKYTIESMLGLKIAKHSELSFEYGNAYTKLCSHFRVLNLSGFGMEENKAAVCAAGGLLSYLIETQKNSLAHINAVKPYTKNDYMIIDVSSRRNLELTETLRDKNKKGSLLWVLDKTKTAMGARLLRKWIEQPLVEENLINARLDAVDEFKEDSLLRSELREYLNTIHDIERIMGKVVYSTANARDFVSLKNSLLNLPHIKNLLSACKTNLNIYFAEELDTLKDIFELIDNTIVDEPPITLREGGIIKDGLNSELDRYREAKDKGSQWLLDFETREKEATGIKNLKVRYNKVFGYYLEVTASYQNLVPDRYIRRQTLANCERYTNEELKEIESAILGASDKIGEIEYEMFIALRDKVAAQIKRIQMTANHIAAIDALQSFAEVAYRNNYNKPKINTNGEINIRNGRHPVVEQMLSTGFVPNDCSMNLESDRMIIVTGPNMAGKSTFMRQVALIVLMAHAGCFVPAEFADISISDRIFTRVGASDDLATGQSTFMVEMSEVANILNNATRNSLIILDEIGRGTSTYDGLSIAWSVVEYITDKAIIGAKTLFATHYHELTALEDKIEGVVNYCVTVKEQGDNIVFLHKMQRGGADSSYGIHVAALAGIPGTVIGNAKKILDLLSIRTDSKSNIRNNFDAETVDYNDIPKPDSQRNKIILKELVDMDLDVLTPREALSLIYDLKEKYTK